VTAVSNIIWDTQRKNIFLVFKNKHKIKAAIQNPTKAKLSTLKVKNAVCTFILVIPWKICAYFLLAAKIYVTDTYLS
jgi:hypothetical protein